MLSVVKKAVVFAGAFLALSGGTARAAVSDVMEVKVPFPFVVEGKLFPAGQYTVEREDAGSPVWDIRGEKGMHAFSFLMTMPAAGHDPAGEKPALTFKRFENQYRLENIWETAKEGQTVIAR